MANTQVRAECPCYAQCVYSFVRLYDRGWCCRGSQKYNHEWDLQQLREVWTKTFKSSAAAEDGVQEDDVEITVQGGASSVGAPADEDAFQKHMRLSNEATTEQLRASTAPRYVKPEALDQLEEWMKEEPIPYISNDKFSQEDIFHHWSGLLPLRARSCQPNVP